MCLNYYKGLACSLPLCLNRCNLIIVHTLQEAIITSLQLIDVITEFLAIILLTKLLLIHCSLSKIYCILLDLTLDFHVVAYNVCTF